MLLNLPYSGLESKRNDRENNNVKVKHGIVEGEPLHQEKQARYDCTK